jgi:hypothetical protein
MADGKTAGQRWRNYRPSKTALFWTCMACIGLTVIVGFTWGGWVTGGSADHMAEQAAKQARTDLVASVCVSRFLDAPDAQAQLAALKKTNSWDQDGFVSKGGWTKLTGIEEAIPDAAKICAERLAKMEIPTTNQASQTDSGTTAIQ